MTSDGAGKIPLSPPHSNNGDFNMHSDQHRMLQEPYTPPRSIRPVSRDIVYQEEHSQYPPPPPQNMYYSPQQAFVRTVNYRSVPAGENAIMTRSGRALGSPIEQSGISRLSKSPRTKRNTKAAKAYKKGATILSGPLSEITAGYETPVRDMAAWVHRPAEVRMLEVEKKKGYVSRPMNSFMLYRSAYAERVKRFCKENNHQVVSQVTGQSWPLEPRAIRELYEQYAIIERDNHAAAHPDYKFAPNKSGKKRGAVDDDSDSDGEWGGSRKTKQSRTTGREDTRSLSGTPFELDQRYGLYHAPPQQHPSSYRAANPHGPAPFSFGPNGMIDQYYQPQHMAYAQNVDDIRFESIETPFPQFDMSSSLIGMPDAGSNGLLDAHPGQIHDIPPEQMVDPRLAQFNSHYEYSEYDGHQESYQIPRSIGYTQYHQPIVQQGVQTHPGMVTLTDAAGGWPQSIQPGLDFDRELQSL